MDHRTCTFCKKRDVVWNDGYTLFKYGVRHYAHAKFLAVARGVDLGREMLPEHMRGQYDAGLIDEGFYDEP